MRSSRSRAPTRWLSAWGARMYATVDARGFRPLLIGRVGGGIVVASETCALDLVGATVVRELLPG